MKKILVSACLLGEPVRYDGTAKRIPALDELRARFELIPFCPEVAGGLPVPRPAAELSGSAREILTTIDSASDQPRAGIYTRSGADLTREFLTGARAALALCQAGDITLAILKERSPSCGVHEVYDGTHQGVRRSGRGLTAELLAGCGIELYTEDTWAELLTKPGWDLEKKAAEESGE